MRVAEIAFGALLSGCVESVIVGPPPLMLENGSRAESLIWLVERDADNLSRVVLAWAGPAAASATLPAFSTPADQVARVHVWMYSESLAELGLVEGELALRGDTDEACRRQGTDVALVEPIPAPSAAFVVELPDRRTWAQTDSESVASLSRLRIERRVPNPCVRFEPRDGSFSRDCPPGERCSFRVVFAVESPDGAIVGRIRYRDTETIGEIFLVDRSATPTLLRTDTSSPAEAAVAIDGDILMLRQHGELFCMRADSSPCRLTVPPPLPPADHEFAAMAAGDGSIFVIRDDGKLWRFESSDWSELPLERSAPCVPEVECGGQVMNGCDLVCRPNVVARRSEVLVMQPHLNAVHHLDDDAFVLDSLPPDEQAPDDHAQSIAFGRVRAAVGTSRGRLLIETQPDRWRHLHTSGRQSHFSVSAIDEGFLLAGENPLVDQWHPDYEMCAPIAFAFFTRITDLAPISLDFLAIGSRDADFDRDFTWLERSDEPGDPCNPTIPIQVDP